MFKHRLFRLLSLVLLLVLSSFYSKASERLVRIGNKDTIEKVLAVDYFNLTIRFSSQDQMDESPIPPQGIEGFKAWFDKIFL